MVKKTTVLLLLIFLFSCVKDEIPSVDPNKCNIDMENYDFSFGIDYSNPEQFLIPGEQSKLSDSWFQEVQDTIGEVPQSLIGVLKVCQWINFNFKKINGNDIGNKTIDQLYAVRTIYDSHAAALIISATLRKFGFPTVMIETASIQWAYDFRDGDLGMYDVHVMTEVFVDDKWILVDNNSTYVSDYDPENPFISAMNKNLYPQGLFVYAKARDTWGYGVRRENDTEIKIKDFANNILCFDSMFGTVNYTWRN